MSRSVLNAATMVFCGCPTCLAWTFLVRSITSPAGRIQDRLLAPTTLAFRSTAAGVERSAIFNDVIR
jgi:hypothetical protein